MKSVSQMSLASFSAILMLALADSAAAAEWTLLASAPAATGTDCSGQVNSFINNLFAPTFGDFTANTVLKTATANPTTAQTPADVDTIKTGATIDTKILTNCGTISVEIAVGATLKSVRESILSATKVIYWGPTGESSCLAQTNIVVPANATIYFSDFLVTNLDKCVALGVTLPTAPTTTCVKAGTTPATGSSTACSADDSKKMVNFLATLNSTISTQCNTDVQQLVGAVLGSNFTNLLNLTNGSYAGDPNSVRINLGLTDPVCGNATDVCQDMLIAGTYSPYPFLANQTALSQAYKKCVNSGVGNSVMAFGAFLAMQLFF